MIELRNDTLVFHFPEVHPQARLRISFQRTLRIPDDGRSYPLPPSLGAFPLRHVDDFAARVPPRWVQRGGVMLPMFQAEAMWLDFSTDQVPDQAAYPFAIKIAAGKIDAASGEDWREGLHRRPQDYLVAPRQPWLDGYCVEKGFIRQFVAMPLGSGYSAEEQLTGAAEHGGVQIMAYPMQRAVFERRFPKRPPAPTRASFDAMAAPPMPCACAAPDMGLAAGGRMRQEIHTDPYDLSDWDTTARSRCFVHLCNSLVWQSITGAPPPHPPPTAASYTRAGLPWFEYYGEGTALPGSERLAGVKSVAQLSLEKGEVVLPENEPVTPEKIVHLRAGLKPGQVRESDL
ncbi:MAG: hypothetical protein ABIO70_35580 [Pseudomonadota bacterium]